MRGYVEKTAPTWGAFQKDRPPFDKLRVARHFKNRSWCVGRPTVAIGVMLKGALSAAARPNPNRTQRSVIVGEPFNWG